MLRSGLEHIEQGVDEGVDATAQILKIKQGDIESRHHLFCRTANIAIERENRNAVKRVGIIWALNHIVLFITAHAMLWTESSGDLEVVQSGERIE